MPDFARRAIPPPDPRRAASLRPNSARAALRLDEFPELLEFQPRPARGHPRDEPPAIAIEKPEVQYIILKPAPGRRQPHSRPPTPLTLGVQLLRYDRRVAFDLALVLRECADGVVQQISTQPACLSFEAQRRMDHSGKARSVPTVEPSLKIRIPSRMMNPRTEVPGEACHFVNWKFRLAPLPLQQRAAQFAAQFFIGIQQENPVVPRA